MPVVIDYSPTNSILNAAANVGANQNYIEGQQLADQQQRLQLAQQAQFQQQQQQGFQNQQSQQEMALRQAEFAAAQQQAQQQQALQQPVAYTAPDGSVARVTPQQKAALQNIDNAQGLTDDQRSFARNRVLGIAPSVTANINGQDVQMDPAQASLAGHRENLDTVAQDKFDLAKASAADRSAYNNTRLQYLRDANDRKLQALDDKELSTQITASRDQVDTEEKSARATLSASVSKFNSLMAMAKELAIENGKKGFNLADPAQPGESPVLTSVRTKLLQAQGAIDAATQVHSEAVAAQNAEHANEVKLLADVKSKRGGAGASAATQSPAAAAPATPAAGPGVGQMLAGATVTRSGTAPDGTRVFQLQDGRIVDANGRPVQ